MRLFKRNKTDSPKNSLLVQYIELLDRLRTENTVLKNKIGDAEHGLDSVLKIFLPSPYSERKPKDLEEMLDVLVDGLDAWRSSKETHIIEPDASALIS